MRAAKSIITTAEAQEKFLTILLLVPHECVLSWGLVFFDISSFIFITALQYTACKTKLFSDHVVSFSLDCLDMRLIRRFFLLKRNDDWGLFILIMNYEEWNIFERPQKWIPAGSRRREVFCAFLFIFCGICVILIRIRCGFQNKFSHLDAWNLKWVTNVTFLDK